GRRPPAAVSGRPWRRLTSLMTGGDTRRARRGRDASGEVRCRSAPPIVKFEPARASLPVAAGAQVADDGPFERGALGQIVGVGQMAPEDEVDDLAIAGAAAWQQM